jgi:hypothetical protein
LGAGQGGGGCGGDDFVADVAGGAGGWVDKEVFCEGCRGGTVRVPRLEGLGEWLGRAGRDGWDYFLLCLQLLDRECWSVFVCCRGTLDLCLPRMPHLRVNGSEAMVELETRENGTPGKVECRDP